MAKSFWDTGLGKFINVITFGIPRIIQGISQPSKNSDGSSNTALGAFNTQNWANTAGDILLGEDYQNNEPLGQQLFGTNLGGLIQSLTNRLTANELTGAEREANAFSAEQAQIDRDFQERMANTQYQRGVADMRAAGVNPALAMSNGGAAAPSGQSASSVQPQGQAMSMSDLMQLLLLRPQMRLMEKQGDADIIRAKAAESQAESSARNASSKEKEVELQEMLTHNTLRIGDKQIEFTDKQMEEISQKILESESRINLQGMELLAKELDYKFSSEMYETNKALLAQELVFRAVEMSNLKTMSAYYNQLRENAETSGEILDDEKVAADLGREWREKHPKWAKFLDQAGIATSAVGNVVHFGVSANFGRSRSSSDVRVDSRSDNVSHTYTHKVGK